MEKAVCIKDVIINHPAITYNYPLNIGEIYTIRIFTKTDNFVFGYRGDNKMGIYPASNFRFIKNYRDKRVNEIINEKSYLYRK